MPRCFAAIAAATLAWAALALGQGPATRDAPRVAAGKRSGLPFEAKFVDIAPAAGLRERVVFGGETRKNYIVEATGSGAALVDIDGDGLLDAFVVNGTRFDAENRAPTPSRLYRNLGAGKFEDITARAGLNRVGWGAGVCAGDFDNDGRTDLFVAYWGRDALYRNLGEGRLEDVAEPTGVAGPAERWSSGCTFVDYDRDGLLDLLVAEYIRFDPQSTPRPGQSATCEWKGLPVLCGPRGLPYGTVTLYRNRGDGSFEDVSVKAGLRGGQRFYAFTAIATDLDGDGWTDIYVASDSTPNLFFVHNGKDSFADFAAETGLAFSEHGYEQSGMGVAVGDYNHDGKLDLIKTNFAGDYPNVYENQGDGIFEDVVLRAGMGVNPQYVGWGVGLVDLDNDGFEDVFQVNGHVYPELDAQTKVNERYGQANVVYRNLGGGRFEDVTDLAGPGLEQKLSSRGAAFGDIDNDGDVDVLIVNMGEPPSLLRNELPANKRWIRFYLQGVRSNRSGVGAIVTVRFGGVTSSRAVLSQSSFLSHDDLRPRFGLGAAEKVDSIVVQWPNGERETFPGAAGGAAYRLVEGSGATVRVEER
jgi:enediyne biosynthesis protein E4